MGEILQGKGVVAGIAIGEVVWVANDYEKWFTKYNSDSPKIENVFISYLFHLKIQ